MKINKKTNVTIISKCLTTALLDEFNDYFILKDNIDILEIKKHDKILFFNALHLINNDNQKKIIDYLLLNHKKFINITNNMEEVLLCKYLVVIDQNQILIEGKTIDVLKETKLLKRIGFNLPFIIDLSFLLKDYGLIDKVYFDEDILIGDLWN